MRDEFYYTELEIFYTEEKRKVLNWDIKLSIGCQQFSHNSLEDFSLKKSQIEREEIATKFPPFLDR